MQLIEYDKENHSLLNKMYILAEIQNQEKYIKLCKSPAHTEIKGNEAAQKAEKETSDVPGTASSRLLLSNHQKS